ncbi:hypothetical protein J6590_020758 [Homalodisca vitripennis]|nr:hypothetical protein J6590_020758 [Homalodisca vitripennis]
MNPKWSACPVIGGVAEVNYKLMVPRSSVREVFFVLTPLDEKRVLHSNCMHIRSKTISVRNDHVYYSTGRSAFREEGTECLVVNQYRCSIYDIVAYSNTTACQQSSGRDKTSVVQRKWNPCRLSDNGRQRVGYMASR